MTTGAGHPHLTGAVEPQDGPQTRSGVGSANSVSPLYAPQTPADWQGHLLRSLVLAERRSIKLDRVAFMQAIAQADTAEQVVSGLVAIYTETDG